MCPQDGERTRVLRHFYLRSSVQCPGWERQRLALLSKAEVSSKDHWELQEYWMQQKQKVGLNSSIGSRKSNHIGTKLSGETYSYIVIYCISYSSSILQFVK